MSAKHALGIVGIGVAVAFALAANGTSKNLESACAVARIAVPGTKEVELEERSYNLAFREERSGRTRNLVPPTILDIAIGDGPASTEVSRSLDATTSSVGAVNVRGIGSVDVSKPGRYTARVTSPETRGDVCIGYQAITDANLFMRSAGVFVLAVLIAVGVGQRGKKKPVATP